MNKENLIKCPVKGHEKADSYFICINEKCNEKKKYGCFNCT
jgi:hypothetical protein